MRRWPVECDQPWPSAADGRRAIGDSRAGRSDAAARRRRIDGRDAIETGRVSRRVSARCQQKTSNVPVKITERECFTCSPSVLDREMNKK